MTVVKNKIVFSIICILFNALIFSCQARAGDIIDESMEKMKLPPSDVIELIENIKLAAQNNLLLTDDFFCEENLLNFSNAKSLRVYDAEGNSFEIMDMKIKGLTRNGLAINKGVVDGKRFTGFVMGSMPLAIDFLIQIFGNFKEIKDPYKIVNPLHPEMLTEKTHIYGNQLAHFDLLQEKTRIIIDVLTSGDGSVRDIEIMQMEK
jgi:hypothetical protein